MEMLFTSDLHLGHKNILLSRQQFASIDEHDEFIIRQWNKKVHKNDNVYILGDLSFRAEHPISYYLSRMKGKKHLIVGNHDSYWMKHVDEMSAFFDTVEYLKTIKFDKKLITLCHYPLLEFPGSRYMEQKSSYLIHGHIHDTKDMEVYGHIKKYQLHALNAGVDINGFEPVTFEELKENNNFWYQREREDKEEETHSMFDYFTDGMK